jgi:hypothetical protein
MKASLKKKLTHPSNCFRLEEKGEKIRSFATIMQSINSEADFDAQKERFMAGVVMLDKAFAKHHARGTDAPDMSLLITAASQHANGFVTSQLASGDKTFDQGMVLWHRVFLSRLTTSLECGQVECPKMPSVSVLQAQVQQAQQRHQVKYAASQQQRQQQQQQASGRRSSSPHARSRSERQLDDVLRMEEEERENNLNAYLPPRPLMLNKPRILSFTREQRELDEVTRMLDTQERELNRIHLSAELGRPITSVPRFPSAVPFPAAARFRSSSVVGNQDANAPTTTTAAAAAAAATATAATAAAACGTICQAKAKAIAAAKTAADAARAAVGAALQRALQSLFGEVKALYSELGEAELHKWAEHLCSDLGITVPANTRLTDASAVLPLITANLPLILSKIASANGVGGPDTSNTSSVAKIQAIVQKNVILGAATAERLLVARAELRFQQHLSEPAATKQLRTVAQAFGLKADDAPADILKRLVPVLDGLVKNGLTLETVSVLLPKLLLLKANAQA